jgi:2-polyprenyl-3-methyl-5-hydroxy-6-metoxy-1,4-benzoquinol methylase
LSEHRAAPLEWTDEQLSTFWGYYAEQRQEDYFTRQFGDRILAMTRSFYRRDAEVCDYGCGPGFLLEKLLRTHRAAGCDFAEGNLSAVRQRLAAHPNLIGAYKVTEVPAGTAFDVVYIVETVEHVLERHREDFFRNVLRLVRPGGIVIATTPNAEDLSASTVFCPGCRHDFHRWQHVRSFDAESLPRFFAGIGFTTVRTFTTDFSARSSWQKAKARLRPAIGKKNPHLVYVGRRSR